MEVIDMECYVIVSEIKRSEYENCLWRRPCSQLVEPLGVKEAIRNPLSMTRTHARCGEMLFAVKGGRSLVRFSAKQVQRHGFQSVTAVKFFAHSAMFRKRKRVVVSDV